MDPRIESVLFSEEKILARVSELAEQINRDYQGKKLVVVGILKGAFMFMSDLCKRLTVPHRIEFMALSSYGNKTTSTGAVRILMDLRSDVADEHVLIVEDIIDSGYTLDFLAHLMKTRSPLSLEYCVFLRKKECLKKDVNVKYLGFDVPNYWVVGYGLDMGEELRTLPYIATIKK
eukprot:TRINITY_DN805_c0_g1_i1.p1 TRINITY_DN805_c0_g1~~TRINITY_DN805_c0_g1_i1.p1  ORF type:complete len:175 (-),score=35.47 TRINITY_DN805_c0_g1_i1:113-637(-)